jgi:hypothetical protein
MEASSARPERSVRKWQWTRTAGAGIAAVVFVVGGLIGLGWVTYYWTSAQQCPMAPPNNPAPGCTGPVPPLTTENATVITVGSVISTAVLSLGVLFAFIALFFPPPRGPREAPAKQNE